MHSKSNIMKHTLLFALILLFTNSYAQTFSGKGDQKFQVGLAVQNNATGLNVSYDYGLGENISIGLSSTYALGVSSSSNAEFIDKFDLKGRFNANIGNVLKIDEKLDVYPGLHFGLKNFGGHLGIRYFFTDGFGVYSELSAPISKYKPKNLTSAEKIHNQVTVNIGAVFNL